MKYRNLQDKDDWSYRQMEDGTIFVLTAPSKSKMQGKSLTSGSSWQAITAKFNSSGVAWVTPSNNNSGSNANANANANLGTKAASWFSKLFAPGGAAASLPNQGFLPSTPSGQNTGITHPPTFMQQYGHYVALGGVGLVLVIAVMAMKGGDDD